MTKKQLAIYQERARARILHVNACADSYLIDPVYVTIKKDAIRLIETNTGSAEGCISIFLSDAEAKLIQAWFAEHDMTKCKQWAHAFTKLLCMRLQHKALDSASLFYHEIIFSLLAADEVLIRWICRHGFVSPNYISRSITGEWRGVIEECLKLSADPPRGVDKLHYNFFIALAQGEMTWMESILEELTNPAVIQRKREYGTGFTQDLLWASSLLYAQLAWRHGYFVNIDSPYVPQEWLPRQSLSEYQDPYEFMKKFDITRGAAAKA